MGSLTIRNYSVLADFAATIRVGHYIAGDHKLAKFDSQGKQLVKIKKKGNCYTVCDFDGA